MTPGAPPSLSLVFSYRNEEAVLEEFTSRVRKVLEGERLKGAIRTFELIFVDDDSQDGSIDLLTRLAAGHQDIKILAMSRCFGISPCALAGLEHSTGELVVYMDCDLQDPPEVIPQMLAAWKEGKDIDVVHTVRLSRDGDSAFRLLMTQLGYWLLRGLASIDLPVEAGDFKLLTRRAVEQLLRFKEKKPYLRGLVCWIGFNSETVPYHRAKRYSGTSKFPILSWRVLGNFLESALVSFSLAPLYVAGFLGLLAALPGLLALACILLETHRGRAIPGWSPAVAAVLCMGSLQLLSLGAIGLYLGSILLEVKGRPNYIIKKRFGFAPEPQSL